MKYRIEIDLSFNNKQEAEDLLNFIENKKDKAHKPTGMERIPCFRKCRYHECSHDEPDPVQCEDYLYIDFDKPKKQHKL